MPRVYVTTPPEIRFWKYVQKTEGCWLWTASKRVHGYGQFGKSHGDIVLAHRFSWELHRGPIPSGLFVLHACDNRPCVNPDHLWLGTAADNAADMARKGRSTKGDRNPSRLYPERRARGEHHGRSKLTTEQVQEIRRVYAATDVSQAALARRFSVCQQTVHLIIRRKKWTHLP